MGNAQAMCEMPSLAYLLSWLSDLLLCEKVCVQVDCDAAVDCVLDLVPAMVEPHN